MGTLGVASSLFPRPVWCVGRTVLTQLEERQTEDLMVLGSIPGGGKPFHAQQMSEAVTKYGAHGAWAPQWMRPYSGESTPSRPIWEVKHRQAQLVLR